MKNFSKKLINLTTSIILVTSATICLGSSSSTEQNPFEFRFAKGTIFENLNSNVQITNDIIYANNVNSLNVYKIPKESADFELGQIPFSWSIDRIGILNDDWSVISYNCEKCYVKNSDIACTKDYNKVTECNDEVIVDSNGVGCKIYSTLDKALNTQNSEQYSTVNDGTILKRFLSLDNGFSLIEFNNEKGFMKSSDLIKRQYLGKFQITYYCPCNICNGGWGAYDYFGNPLIDGTAAVDTSLIPFGTSFQIEEDGYTRDCIAKDIGGAIQGAHIDVFVDVPHSVCEQMGNSKKDVYTYVRCN